MLLSSTVEIIVYILPCRFIGRSTDAIQTPYTRISVVIHTRNISDTHVNLTRFARAYTRYGSDTEVIHTQYRRDTHVEHTRNTRDSVAGFTKYEDRRAYTRYGSDTEVIHTRFRRDTHVEHTRVIC